MKWTGFGASACALLVSIACTGEGRRDGDVDHDGRTPTPKPVDESDAIGTGGLADGAHGATADARHFVEKATFAGNAEVKLGQLAIDHAQSAQVREFAQMMVRDHSKSGNELKQALTRHNVDPPSALDDEHQRVFDRLSILHGAEFDREYMEAMLEGHAKVKSMLASRTMHAEAGRARATGTSGTNASDTQLDMVVNQWASEALPMVEQHLQKALHIRATVESGNAGAHAGDAGH